MRRPVLYAVVVIGVLLALGAPFLRCSSAASTSGRCRPATESRIVTETIDRDFPASTQGPITSIVTLPDAVDSPAGAAALQSYVGAVDDVPGVDGATVTGAAGDTARVSVAYGGDPVDKARPRPGAGGPRRAGPRRRPRAGRWASATLADLLASLGRRCPGWR